MNIISCLLNNPRPLIFFKFIRFDFILNIISRTNFSVSIKHFTKEIKPENYEKILDKIIDNIKFYDIQDIIMFSLNISRKRENVREILGGKSKNPRRKTKTKKLRRKKTRNTRVQRVAQ